MIPVSLCGRMGNIGMDFWRRPFYFSGIDFRVVKLVLGMSLFQETDISFRLLRHTEGTSTRIKSVASGVRRVWETQVDHMCK